MKNFKLIFTALFALAFVFQACQKEDLIENDERFVGTRSYEQPEHLPCDCPEGESCSHSIIDEGGDGQVITIKGRKVHDSYDQAVRVVVSWEKINDNDPVVTGLQVYPISDYNGYSFSIVDYSYKAELIDNGSGFMIILDGERCYHYEFGPCEERPINDFFVLFDFSIF